MNSVDPMDRSLLALRRLVPLACVVLGFNPVHAQVDDMFPTRIAALKRAQELKCSGAFAMGSEWMPCSSLEAYEHAVKTKS